MRWLAKMQHFPESDSGKKSSCFITMADIQLDKVCIGLRLLGIALIIRNVI